mmetsp:Transcript_11785/g.15953  ORF Transcript_11785/g.15953 Transcript_11785/m.15953 type:complete len:481 (-) Transcript_11785:197-1639(-)
MGHRKKRRTHVKGDERPGETKGQHPKSIVMRRGRLGGLLTELEKDLRKVMEPNTAAALKESKRNTLKDFVHVAGPLGVTHFLILSATQQQSYLRIATVPRGPTLTLGIKEYTLSGDIAATARNYSAPPSIFKTPPLVVLNNFVGEKHLRLAAVVCQNMFPSINVKAVKLATCKRVVLLDYDSETGVIHFRHFHITAQPAGVSKRIHRLAVRGSTPNMSGFNDIADYLAGGASDSEGEDTAAKVVLPQDIGRANTASTQSSLKLRELGPRLELELVKLEEGVCMGQVLYHKYVEKSADEIAATQTKREKSETEKEARVARRATQEAKVEAKAKAKEEARQAERKRQGCRDITAKHRGQHAEDGNDDDTKESEDGEGEYEDDEEKDEDSDTEWYRQEVGEEPDENFKKNVKARKAKQELHAQLKAEKKLQKEKDQLAGKPSSDVSERSQGKSSVSKKRKNKYDEPDTENKKPKAEKRKPAFT